MQISYLYFNTIKVINQYHMFFILSLQCNFRNMNIDKVLLILIIANVLFSIKGFSDRSFFDKYKFQIGAINRGEKIRMFTSAFLHVDYMHLILNMYVLYIFAPDMIETLGIIKFLILYIGSLFTDIIDENPLYEGGFWITILAWMTSMYFDGKAK